MNSIKYIALGVHQSTISTAVLDGEGKLVMQSVLATHASAILDFIHGLRGSLHVTFEEGTHSAWLYDLLARRVAQLVVCNPRKNALLKAGNKSDSIDARKLAELLRAGLLSPVYHGENSAQTVKQLGPPPSLRWSSTHRAPTSTAARRRFSRSGPGFLLLRAAIHSAQSSPPEPGRQRQ